MLTCDTALQAAPLPSATVAREDGVSLVPVSLHTADRKKARTGGFLLQAAGTGPVLVQEEAMETPNSMTHCLAQCMSMLVVSCKEYCNVLACDFELNPGESFLHVTFRLMEYSRPEQ